MAISLQLGFADYEQTYAKKKTRRQVYLEEMEATIPWDDFHALIRPVYHQPSAKGGRPPFPLEVMLRIHLLQQWFTLSDPLMEEMLIDTPCFRRFAGIDLIDGRIPDESTIMNFRHLLEEHQIAEQVLERVNQSLSEQGLLKEGTILDATIINAPSSTKNKQGERDPEMHSVAKGNQWFFGIRCHMVVDADSDLVHSVVSTAANVHELNTAAERVHGATATRVTSGLRSAMRSKTAAPRGVVFTYQYDRLQNTIIRMSRCWLQFYLATFAGILFLGSALRTFNGHG